MICAVMSSSKIAGADLFCKEIIFLQKVIISHPTRPEIFLALRRSAHDAKRPNDWDLAGGHVLFGEDSKESLLREVKEEVGIGIKDIFPIQVTTTYEKEQSICKLLIGYRGIALSDKIELSPEHTSYLWVSFEEFKELTNTRFLLDLAAIAKKYDQLRLHWQTFDLAQGDIRNCLG